MTTTTCPSDGQYLCHRDEVRMTDSAMPRCFEQLPMQWTTSDLLDDALSDVDSMSSVLFPCSRDCRNSAMVKRSLLQAKECLTWLQQHWTLDNAYEATVMARRSGLNGRPVFFVFRGTRKLGHITSWLGCRHVSLRSKTGGGTAGFHAN